MPVQQQIKKKKNGKSLFRRINDWLHLWLGLSSGLIVFVVSITGCIYAFQEELSNLTQPYRFVKAEERPFLLPSELKAIAAQEAFGKDTSAANKIGAVVYGTRERAAIATYTDKQNGFTLIYINPYNGTVLHKKTLKDDFFRIILEGHFNLWLPRKIGQPIVATGVLIFVILLITGLIMWWPKRWNKKNRKKSFSIKWDAGKKRVNYDLHNVLGFYVMLIALVLGLTGLVWGFEWFSKSWYFTATGGKTLEKFERGLSDTTRTNTPPLTRPEDKIWAQVLQEFPHPTGSTQIQFALRPKDPITLILNPDEGTFYKREFRFYDQYTLQRVKGGGLYGNTYASASRGEKLYRMNYDIHVGAIGGLPGKMLMFFASLICASLPITGFYIWWGRRKKKTAGNRKILPARVAASL